MPQARWYRDSLVLPLVLAAVVVAAPIEARMPVRTIAAPGPDSLSFTHFLLLTDVHTTPAGQTAWFRDGASFDGPVHSNGELAFAGRPVFTDVVTSASSAAWFYNQGAPVELASDHNGTIDVPAFSQAFQLGAPAIPLPADPYNQQGAALSATLAYQTSAPTNVQLNQYCRNINSSSALPTAVYVPTFSSLTWGGIYVQGTLDSLTMFASGNSQVYRFRQDAYSTVVTVDNVNNQTYYKVGSNAAVVYSGKPDGSLFVNGTISNLCGPPRVSGTPLPAIQSATQLLITASGDIVIQRDLTVQDYATGGAVLGLYASHGNVRIGTSAPDDVAIDAFVLASGGGTPDVGALGVDGWDTGAPRGAVHLRGGCVESYFGPFGTLTAEGVPMSGYARDLHLDRRGLYPPYFPRVLSVLVGVPLAAVPSAVRLAPPSPDPIRGMLHVEFDLPQSGRVQLTAFDVAGRRVAAVLDERRNIGHHVLQWRPRTDRGMRFAPGVYFLALEQAGARVRRRIVVLE